MWQAVVGASLDVSEQENNVVKTASKSHPMEGKLAVFLKHILPLITHFKCFLVSNLNLFCCNHSSVCLTGVGKQLDRAQ